MFKQLADGARLPSKAHGDDVGYDLHALEDYVLNPGRVTKVRTGIAYGGLDAITQASASGQIAIFPKVEGRSGIASKGVWPVGGIIDPGYRGELVVMLYNSNRNSDCGDDGRFVVKAGERIAQLVFYTTVQPNVEVGELKASERGASGFGSTGK